jgi:hypothetical protein
LAGNLAENKFANFVNARSVLLNPVVAGDPAIQIAQLHVARDFLRADQADFHLRIIHVRNVRAAADLHVEARLGHLLDGGVLQAAFGQPKLQFLQIALHPVTCWANEASMSDYLPDFIRA